MKNSPIAIVGYGYRMPGGIQNDQDFWRLLKERESIQVPIHERYGAGYEPVMPEAESGKFNSAFEGLITEGRELEFDCKLFGISSHSEGNQLEVQIDYRQPNCGC